LEYWQQNEKKKDTEKVSEDVKQRELKYENMKRERKFYEIT